VAHDLVTSRARIREPQLRICQPVARRVFSSPDRCGRGTLGCTSAQEQAEELLERAIGTTPGAESFRHLQDSCGHIRMTDRMKQLERRSEFSKDLRVRYANVDINLLWKLAKEHQAAIC